MLMESYFHERWDHHGSDNGHSTDRLPKSPHSPYEPASYSCEYPTDTASSNPVQVSSAAGLDITSSLGQYPIQTFHSSTTDAPGSGQHSTHLPIKIPPQWDAETSHHNVSYQYLSGCPSVELPTTSQYIYPAIYPAITHPIQPLPLYEGHSALLNEITSDRSDVYTEPYVTSATDVSMVPIGATHLQHAVPWATYPETHQYIETSVCEDPQARKTQQVVSIAKPNHLLGHRIVKKSTDQITKQKRPAIVKGDRGKQSRAESCWRCRRYKKPCNKAVDHCSSCITSGFRIWPSTLGCRRGQMTDFALLIVPSNVEALTQPKTDYPKPRSWRRITDIFDNRFGEQNLTRLDKWDQLIMKIKAIKILGPGVVELLQIAANCERRHEKQNIFLNLSARCLSMTVDLWQIFVATTPGERFNHELNVKEIFVTLRQLLISCVQRFLTSCLTGRLKDWFGTFMAVNILGLVYIILGDTVLAIPDKDEVWPDIKKTVLDLRTFHPICRDLLYVLAKGCDLLNMNWAESEESLRLMDNDKVICEAMRDLQLWRDNLMDFLDDDCWMEVAPFEVDLLPVTSLSRLFLQIQRKDDRPGAKVA